jgi:hypothetical protein
MVRLWASAVAAGIVGFLIKRAVPWSDPLLRGALIIPAFAGVYFACTAALGIGEARRVLRTIRRG